MMHTDTYYAVSNKSSSRFGDMFMYYFGRWFVGKKFYFRDYYDNEEEYVDGYSFGWLSPRRGESFFVHTLYILLIL